MEIAEAYLFMKRAFLAGRLAQGYLVVGAPRVEGRALAEKVSQMLLCGAEGAARPCGKCRGCMTAAPGKHPDVYWVEPQLKTRRISVDEVRALRQGMMSASFIQGGWKVGVVLSADRMTDGSANAFLKVLEEPPARSLFLLLTDAPHALLPTVVSRCQTVLLSQETRALSEPVRDMVAAAICSGDASALGASIRAGRFAGLLAGMRAEAEAEVKASLEADPSWAAIAADERKDILNARTSARYREMRDGLILFLFEWYRDVLCVACGGGNELLRNPKYGGSLADAASGGGVRGAMRSLRAVEEARLRLERNLPEAAVFEEAAACMA
jgi:DNA polymerase-3 subunit delta'